MVAAGDCEAALAALPSYLVAMLLLLLTLWLRKCFLPDGLVGDKHVERSCGVDVDYGRWLHVTESFD